MRESEAGDIATAQPFDLEAVEAAAQSAPLGVIEFRYLSYSTRLRRPETEVGLA